MKKVKVLLMVTLPLLLAFYVTVTNKMKTKRYQNEVLTLDNVESLSFDVGEWWDSKTHKCVEDQCSFSVGVITWYGKYEKCLDGNEEAHCTACKSCDAIFAG